MKKKIIVFGASGKFQQYYEMLKKRYDILFVCDNDEKKWGDHGEYKVCNPEVLLEYQDYPVVIISSYEEEIYVQLEKMGIRNIHTLYGPPRENETLQHRKFPWNMIKESNPKKDQELMAKTYCNWNDHLRARKIVQDTFSYGINQQEHILDYGFGCGTLILWFLYNGYDIKGIDIDQKKKQFYDMKIDELGYPKEWKENGVLYDGKTIPYEDESFDLIFCDYVLEHVPDLYHSLSEMTRVCKKGGRIRLACPNYNASFEEHYLIDFGKPLHGHKSEFKKFLAERGEDTTMLDEIYFVNPEDILNCIGMLGNFEIIDLNKKEPLSGISLLLKKL